MAQLTASEVNVLNARFEGRPSLEGEPLAARFAADDVTALNARLEGRPPQEVLKWGLETFHPHIALASSFSVEDVTIIDMLVTLNPAARVFALDTGRLNEETYQVADAIRQRYGITIEFYFPDRAAVERLERAKGLFSFRESLANRHECCGIRKVEPLNRALSGLKAWITGLRREQSVTRTQVGYVELDAAHGNIAKLNPLAAWTSDQVSAYVRENKIPYNKLHDQGYPSIGCAPCTRAIKPGEHPRAGRWWWENPEHKECGLHVGKH